VARIKHDVIEALRAGRVSTEIPGWWCDSGLPQAKPAPYAAYVWPLDCDVIYVLTRERNGAIYVRTILTDPDQQAA
jgi:hypothetical protein